MRPPPPGMILHPDQALRVSEMRPGADITGEMKRGHGCPQPHRFPGFLAILHSDFVSPPLSHFSTGFGLGLYQWDLSVQT